MDDPQSLLLLAGGLTLLLAVITEALMCLSFIRVSLLEKRRSEKNRKAAQLLKLLDGKKEKILSGLSMFRLVTAIALGFVFSRGLLQIKDLPPEIIVYIYWGTAGFVILVSEIIPRFLAYINPEAMAGFLYPFIYISAIISVPVSDICSKIFIPVFRRFQSNGEVKTGLTEEEIMHIVHESHKMGVLDKEQKEMIRSVFEFDNTIAREVMVPRVDITAADKETKIADVIDLMVESGFSRIPIYEESLDNILGIVYHKDFLGLIKENRLDTPAMDIARKPPYFVPDTKPADELLADMQHRSISIAVVVDEYGGTSGIVTIEDLLEELVGEITDEYDQEIPEIIDQPDGSWMVDGGTIIEDVNEALQIDVPSDEHETIGGFVFGHLGHIPQSGESMSLEELGIDITVEKIEGQRIQILKIAKHTKPETED